MAVICQRHRSPLRAPRCRPNPITIKTVFQIHSKPFATRGAALFLPMILLTAPAHGDATFDFNDGTNFDNVGIGATMTVLDAAESINVTLTSVDIIGQDGTLASDGVDLHKTNIQGTEDSTWPLRATESTSRSKPILKLIIRRTST